MAVSSNPAGLIFVCILAAILREVQGLIGVLLSVGAAAGTYMFWKKA